MTPEQARVMASYNRWMNERLYGVCAQLSDAERKRDRQAFFRSIHGTLNHVLLADKLWMGRFEGKPFRAQSLDQELCADFGELRAERATTDARIETWAQSLSEAALAQTLHYTSMTDPAPRTRAMWLAVAHLFNHQTHHRGQVTALLSQCRVDYGVTDLISCSVEG